MRLEARLSCPACGHVTLTTMPENACVYFFDCPACGKGLTPLAGDCCVFCSYADAPCPPRQVKEPVIRPR
ncbi:MAG: hypothetical protein FJX66_02540 [Alphaproteobacteria bacterium]|nr:hypothetical protein [Alphaproteobacteria bacterium]